VPGDAEVLLLDHAETGGGGQRFALRLATELRARGRSVRVGCERDTSLAGWCREAGIEHVAADYPRPSVRNARGVAAAIRATRRLLRAMPSGSLVIGNHTRVHAYLYVASRRMQTPPIVNIVHAQEAAQQAVARYLYRRFGAPVVIGENTRREFRRRLPGIELVAASNFLSAGYLSTAPRHEARRTTTPALGVLARLIPEKGIAELIEELASSEVSAHWRTLAVAAPRQDPDYALRVERRVEELGLASRVSLLGEVADVDGFLESIDVLVVPSTGNEAQPTVILEGLAHGMPVLVRAPLYSADYEGLPVVPYESLTDLAAALEHPPAEAAPVDELIRRFGPDQSIAGIDAAAQLARARS
jgi:glycosyltransferase involved in cell wall biosynthesis